MKQRNISKGIYSLYVIMFMLMIPIGDLWAQDPLNISGKVVDVNNEPLIGATVQVKGKQTGTITNIEGRFSVKVQAKDILVISYMGYTSQEMIASKANGATITLVEDGKTLEKLREANTQLQYERNKEQIEKDKIKAKLLEKKKKRGIEKLALQELIDEGEIFPEANKRPPIPKDVVDTVWNRDGGKCVYCGSNENLHLDHIIPFSKGGDTSVENLQLLCQKCNLEKSNKIGYCSSIMIKSYTVYF